MHDPALRRNSRRCDRLHLTTLYLAGALEPDEARQTVEHIAECPVCRSFYMQGSTAGSDVAVTSAQAGTFQALDVTSLQPTCKQTVSCVARGDPPPDASEDHRQECWLCSFLALYSRWRSRVTSGGEPSPAPVRVRSHEASPSAWDRVRYEAVCDSVERTLDRALGELVLAGAPAAVADEATHAVQTCRESTRWGAVAGEVRGLLARAAERLRDLGEDAVTRLRGECLLLAELALARRQQRDFAPAGYPVELAFAPVRSAGAIQTAGTTDATRRARHVVVKRGRAPGPQWFFLVVRTDKGTHVCGPVESDPRKPEVCIPVPKEVEGVDWQAEVFVTDRDPKDIEALSANPPDERSGLFKRIAVPHAHPPPPPLTPGESPGGNRPE